MSPDEIMAMKPTFGEHQEFDALVAEMVMGWTRVHPVTNRRGGTKLWGFPPGYKHVAVVPLFWWDGDATLAVVKRLRDLGLYVVVETFADFYRVTVRREDGSPVCVVSLPDLKECIGKAAIIAVMQP